MKYAALIGLLALAVGCSNVTARSSRGNNRDNNNKPGTGTGTGSGKQTYDPDKDQDLDGYTPNQGDCDDTTPLVNPGAAEVIGNNYDDDCDGEADEVDSECESLALGKALFYRQLETGLEPADADASRTIAANFALPSAAEGVAAFLEKRPPNWES